MPAEAPVAPPAAAVPQDGKLPAGPLDQQSREAFAEPFAALDQLGKDDGVPDSKGEPTSDPEPKATPEPQPKTQAQIDRERDEQGKFLPKKDDPKADPKVQPTPKGTPKDAAPDPKGKPTEQDDEPIEKMAPKQLREAYHKRTKEYEAAQKELAELRTKASTPAEDPEKKVLTEKLTAHEKRLAELDEELRYTAYERSQEFKDKYEKPYVDAWLQGRSNMSSLDVIDRKNEETGEVLQQGRPATAEDFDALMKLDDRSFRKQASQLFGPEQLSELIADRKEVMKLLNSKNKALEDFRKEGTEREQKRAKQIEENSKLTRQTWEQANKTAVEKYPQWFAPDEADPKGNELLEKGYHMADRAFSDGRPIKEGDKPLSPLELTRLQSALRNKGAAFDRLVHKLSTLQKAHDDLAEKLKGYEESEPGPGDGKRTAKQEAQTEEGDYNAAFTKEFGK